MSFFKLSNLKILVILDYVKSLKLSIFLWNFLNEVIKLEFELK